MNKNELEIMLNTLLIGQEIDLRKYYNHTCESVLKKLRDYVGDENYFKMSYRYDNRYCHFYYRDKSLFGFKVKTKQEYKHERYTNIYYVYIIQSLVLLSYSCENLEQRMQEIDSEIESTTKKEAEEKERKQREMFGIYKQLHVFWGKQSREIIRYFNEHYYELEDMRKKECEEKKQ